MAKSLRQNGSRQSLLKTLWKIAPMLFSGVKPFLHYLQEELNEQLDHYATLLEKRLAILALCGSTLFLSLFSIWVGTLLMLIDYAGVPRGIACFCGGSFGLIMLVLWVQLTKRKGRAA